MAFAEVSGGRHEDLAPIIYPGHIPYHILEAQQFSREWLEQDLFPLAAWMEQVHSEGKKRSKILKGKMGYNLFYEPSTRTRTSFEAAILNLGGIFSSTENAKEFSSAIKGETLEDTIRIINGYGYDYIVLRYDETGGAARAARVSGIPIINAGDGKGQHPTQSLLDVYTIRKELGHISGLRVAMSGDLERGRTDRSLAYLLAKFPGVSLDFVSPWQLRMGDDIKEYLDEKGVPYREHTSLRPILHKVDVVYLTRPQKERPKAGRNGEAIYIDESAYRECGIDLEAMGLMQSHAIVMHPLPRNEELPTDCDSDPRMAAFRQAQNGLYVRMALLDMILGAGTKSRPFTLFLDGYIPKIRHLRPMYEEVPLPQVA
ncbi:aspartate carbamoyltransferase [Candidatus Daviesbacteria bacterium]|nr:aspartate carbamoyltransferase [Candidatus Daviesbacteria bacterium]